MASVIGVFTFSQTYAHNFEANLVLLFLLATHVNVKRFLKVSMAESASRCIKGHSFTGEGS